METKAPEKWEILHGVRLYYPGVHSVSWDFSPHCFIWFVFLVCHPNCTHNMCPCLHTILKKHLQLQSCSKHNKFKQFSPQHTFFWKIYFNEDASNEVCNSRNCTLYSEKISSWAWHTATRYCLTFQLCNMFACIVNDIQIVFVPYFSSSQTERGSSWTVCPPRPLQSSISVRVFLYQTQKCWYFVPNSPPRTVGERDVGVMWM